MRPDARDLGRTAIRVALIAAGVGLLVLLLAPLARSQESAPEVLRREAERVLDRSPVSSDERVEQAREVLERERDDRLLRLSERALQLGMSLSLEASPRRLFKGVRRLVHDVRGLDDRGPAEEEALRLLEPQQAQLDAGDPDDAAFYLRLRDRDRQARVAELIARVRADIEGGHLQRARRTLRRIEHLDPQAAQLHDLRTALVEARDREVALLEVRPEELAATAALLAGHGVEAASAARSDEARLVSALVREAAGERAEALAEIEAVAEGDGAAARTARQWLADPRAYPEQALDRGWKSARVETWLGRIGGEELARNGAELSNESLRAWRHSAQPLNLAVSMPVRLATEGYAPRADAYRSAAAAYLERFPDGERADEVRERLAELGASDPDRLDRAFRDGRLELPLSSTRGVTAPPELLVTGAALIAAGVEDLDLPRAWLRATGDGCGSIARRGESAHTLLDVLGAGLESGGLRSAGEHARALERLRELDAAVARGRTLCLRADAPLVASVGSLRQALVAGGSARAPGSVDVVRGGEDVRLTRQWRASGGCGVSAMCIDARRAIDGFVHARLETDGDVRIGATAQIEGASFAIDMGRSGPRAQLVVPFARWLGLSRWLPVEAQVDISLTGAAIGPRLTSR